MRIITGTARGTKLDTLSGEATRPTTEIVKEAIFSAIQFDVHDRTVLDLFGGCGQLALEALSRGAERAVIIDSSRDAIQIIKQNAQKTHLYERTNIASMDWRAYVKSVAKKEKFSLVFLDPPYKAKSSDEKKNLLDEILKEIISAGILSEDAIIVCESDADGVPEPIEDANNKIYRYGKTYVTIIRF